MPSPEAAEGIVGKEGEAMRVLVGKMDEVLEEARESLAGEEKP